MHRLTLRTTVFLLFFLATNAISTAQGYWDNLSDKSATLGLDEGISTYKTDNFILKLVNASQTVAGLSPISDPDLDFTPGDRLEVRGKDGLYWLGDLNLRIRQPGADWKSYSTAAKRKPITTISAGDSVLAAADLSATLPSDIPVKVTRYYEKSGGALILRFRLENKSLNKIEIGALGVPMGFNNILEGKSLDETHMQNVFFDPYIGEDAGYLEVKRLNGLSPGMLVLPEENMPF